jgi:tetratricopeptide (TPR) repeat protein/transcriptional regulator with XRE-family HTH domain
MASIQPVPIGTLLKRYRRSARLTQEELAARAGYSAAYISLLERNVRLPTPATIAALAEALDLSPAERVSFQATLVRPAFSPPARTLHASSAPSMPPLVGRTDEVLQLDQHLADVGPPLLLLAGEPGIGKTRLLLETARRAEAAGWTVLEGSCHRRSGQEPYTPLLGALADHLRRQSAVQQRVSLEGCAWLVRLLPELVETRLVPAPSWTLSPEQERRLMFAAVARYLANVAGPLGTLLVLDDLQWAGADALDLLASLLRTPGELPLRVVGAYRSTEVRPSDLLGALVADLSAAELAKEARLGPLSPDEASGLLQGLLEGQANADASLREHLLRRTGGLPYFLVSCAQALREDALKGRAAEALPWNVAQSIRQRIGALPPAAQELLCVAAVVGREAPGTLLLALASKPTAETVTTIEALDRARLLIEGAEARYQFPHDLIREVVLSDLSAMRRAHVHQRVAEALEQVPARQQEGRAAELAWHWLEAGDAERALPYVLLAGDQAEAAYAHQDAERHYQSARDLAHELGDQRREAEALQKLGYAVRCLGRFLQAVEVLEQALGLYQAIGEVETQGYVLALIGQLHAYAGAGTPAAGVARVQPLVAPLGAAGLSLGGQSALYVALSELYINTVQYREALSAAEQAQALAEQVHESRLLGQARLRRGVALLNLGRAEEGVQVLEDTLPLLEASGDLETLSRALHYISTFLEDRGKYDLALAATERSLAIVERLGILEGIATTKRRRGALLMDLGQWKQARQDFEQATTLLPAANRFWPRVMSYVGLGLLSLAQGQGEEAAEHLERALALAEQSEHPIFLFWASCAVAYQDLVEGRLQAARARLEPFLDRSSLQAGEQAWMQHLLGWASVELGDLERAEVLLAEASTLATGSDMVGVLHSQVRLALRQGREQEAEHALAKALALCQAMHTPYDEAQTLYLNGLLLLQQGKSQPAHERLEAALAILNRLGERLYAEQVERALAEGIRP